MRSAVYITSQLNRVKCWDDVTPVCMCRSYIISGFLLAKERRKAGEDGSSKQNDEVEHGIVAAQWKKREDQKKMDIKMRGHINHRQREKKP